MSRTTLAIGVYLLGGICGAFIGKYIATKSEKTTGIDYIMKEKDLGIYGFRIKMKSDRVFDVLLPNPVYPAGDNKLGIELKVVEGYERQMNAGQHVQSNYTR